MEDIEVSVIEFSHSKKVTVPLTTFIFHNEEDIAHLERSCFVIQDFLLSLWEVL